MPCYKGNYSAEKFCWQYTSGMQKVWYNYQYGHFLLPATGNAVTKIISVHFIIMNAQCDSV